MPEAGQIELGHPEAVAAGAEGRAQKVMVVDDEVLNLKLIQAMLKPQGYQVILAGDGAECLAKIEEDPPDLVLMDIMMPHMDGFEVVRTLKTRPHLALIPIVMVTALQDINDRVKALEVGADDFLTKPVDRMELRARVRSLLKVKAYNDHMANYRMELEREVAAQTEELRLAHSKLRDASLETIFRLARAAEYKDEDTGAHIISMSRISAYLAECLGLNPTAVERILYASPMHDIGKIGIPDRILTKSGPLNDEEWGVMRMHPIYGAQILEGSRIGFISLGEVISLTHHEKWDGSGYPHGLAGTRIPLVGRIVAVADVFDALRSKRPYKPPLSLEQTVEIIRAGRGTHFDPRVADALLNNIDAVHKIWEDAQACQSAALQQTSLDSTYHV